MKQFTALLTIVILISIFEIYQMRKKKMTRELVWYIVLLVCTLVLGWFYFSDTYQDNFAELIVRMMGKYK